MKQCLLSAHDTAVIAYYSEALVDSSEHAPFLTVSIRHCTLTEPNPMR